MIILVLGFDLYIKYIIYKVCEFSDYVFSSSFMENPYLYRDVKSVHVKLLI